ncbi:YfhO family protein [Leptobacterium sp. I13]|uniref:YfhO family protein n=1 Tax=Leptobacterium meishanense TaxID=3128904 RepID=UPI0030EB20A9
MYLKIKKILPHFIVTTLFIIISLAYFHPVLQGKKIFQNDIAQYIGMAKERNDLRAEENKESYWTNSAFGGMPTYQLGAQYPHDYIKKIDRTIRFLPRPADYLFLYFIGFYVLLLVLKVDYKLAFLGALGFGFSTYLIIILGVGHNAKAHAIAYFPIVLSGILLAFQRKYVYGFLLTALAMALEISANHFQMTYYLLLLVLILGVVYLIQAIQRKELVSFFKTVGVLALAVILSLWMNATNLLATQEYTKWSTRGKSELIINPDGSIKEGNSGLSKEYITEYSYGIVETLNLFVPRLFGGSNNENLGKTSKTYEFLIQQGVPRSQAIGFAESLPAYWGDQPIVAAPAYVGAVVLFLFILSLFLVKGTLKKWLLGGIILSLLLSWGKNLAVLTDFMIDYFPLYNKFRAVSSIQVVLELCIPVMAILGLTAFFNKERSIDEKKNALKWTTIITAGVGILLFFAKGSFDFVGSNDGYYRQVLGNEIVEMIKLDRKAVYNHDLFRTLIFVALSAAVLWGFIKGMLRKQYTLGAFTLLILFDMIGVAQRYVNKNDFVQARRMEKPFQATPVDTEILKDTTHYRVYEPSLRMAGGRASYFHKAIGGYHAAKPGRFQELYDYQIAQNNVGVLNMLNVKYIIRQNEQGQTYPALNPYANGNAWFVTDKKTVNTADEEIKALKELDTKTEIVLNKNDVPEEVILKEYERDTTATIELVSYHPDALIYESETTLPQLAVFSEVHYPKGWQVFIDGNPIEHFRANYVLRAMEIPEGKHTIHFKFDPEVVKTGSVITLTGSIIFGILLIGGLYMQWIKREKVPEDKQT